MGKKVKTATPPPWSSHPRKALNEISSQLCDNKRAVEEIRQRKELEGDGLLFSQGGQSWRRPLDCGLNSVMESITGEGLF